MLGALYGARLMNVFERQSDIVGMTAVSDLVNGWPGGIIQAGRHGLFVTPIYLVNRLYATHVGASRLSSRVDGPTQSTTREGTDVPLIDVVASRSADGRVFLKMVNTDLKRAHTAEVTIRGGHVGARGIVERVVADSLASFNGFATPEAVHATKGDVAAGNHFTLTLPRHSVSVITLTTAN